MGHYVGVSRDAVAADVIREDQRVCTIGKPRLLTHGTREADFQQPSAHASTYAIHGLATLVPSLLLGTNVSLPSWTAPAG